MATKTLMSVEEYLRTAFDDGDCEYVDGEIVGRNVGKFSHSWIQKRLLAILTPFEEPLGLGVYQELRFRATPTRYRIPDIGVWKKDTLREEVPSVPPLIAIEILSAEDRMSRMVLKVNEYLSVGVECVWVIDPEAREVILYSQSRPGGQVGDLLISENPAIRIPLADVLPPR